MSKRKIERWMIVAICLVLFDFFVIHLAYLSALWLRFDSYAAIPQIYLNGYIRSIGIYAVLTVALLAVCYLYRSLWRYAGYAEMLRLVIVSVGASTLYSVILTVLLPAVGLERMPLSYYIWGAVLQLMLMILPRFGYRLASLLRRRFAKEDVEAKRVMIVGAGSAGQLLLQDMQNAKEISDRVVCFVDDDSNKWGRFISGVPVIGGRDDIMAGARKYRVDKIYLAIPTASAETKRDLLHICSETGCELKQLPGMYQLVLGQVSVNAMRDVAVEDLLGREPIRADLKEVFDFIHGKRVLVTGGGGSIGSELCRQIAAHEPEQLVIFDVYENNAYAIQLELRKKYPDLDLVVLIGSVRDSRRIFDVFKTYHPQVVYHAAAHKHVPLMEDSPNEAIKNNAIGTYKTAYAAMVNGCERFVLISTDKAVHPTNIMGASKRLCEMIVQSFDKKIKEGKAAEIPQLFTHLGVENADKDGTGQVFQNIKTEFVAVRFGNVLGSNGSVIPIFKEQIAAGGPVTVTHPDIIRYFMTVKEAVSLVLLAGTYAHGGEIFVLDMGEPVKIDTLARNMIKLSGFQPDVDIKIAYTGLRPGEKLYEEKLMAEEGLRKTDNKLIHIGQPIPFDTDAFLKQLDDLMQAAYSNKADIRDRVKAVVGTYHPDTAAPNTEKPQ